MDTGLLLWHREFVAVHSDTQRSKHVQSSVKTTRYRPARLREARLSDGMVLGIEVEGDEITRRDTALYVVARQYFEV